jgi:predicted permease
MEEELQLHLELAAEDMRRRGNTPDDAARAARLQFGALAQAMEAMRDQRGIPWLDDLIRDVRHALHSLRRSPVFTAVALLTLALGIGGNTAVFSIVNTVLLKPVPLPDSDRLVMFMRTSPGGQGSLVSPTRFQYLRRQSSIQDAAAFRRGTIRYTGGELPEQLYWAQVSAEYFKLFGAPIVKGRGFSVEEDLPNGPKAALISYSFWTQRFASDPNVVGKKISLNDEPHIVIGVVGPTFDFRDFGPALDVWTAFQFDPNTNDQGQYFQAAGRLKPEVTLQQAKEEFKKSAAEYREKFPNEISPSVGFTVEPIQQVLVSNARQTLFVLFVAVTFLLLIACANVANLLFMRASSRKREIAIRASLGAGRARIIRQLLTESVLLSVPGGLLGILLGVWGIRVLLSVNTAGLPRVGAGGAFVNVDWRVLGFTLLISLVTGILFGLIPALQASRADLNSNLKESGRGLGSGFRQNRFRSLLVVVEIALAVILLTGSALLIRTQLALVSVDPGFQTAKVLTMRMSLTGPKFLRSAALAQVVSEGVARIHSVPGVVSAAAACCLPLQLGPGGPFRIMGRPLVRGPFHGTAAWSAISPGYFEVFSIPIKRGRDFTDRDDSSAAPVVIINESMAKRFWVRGDDPLTARLLIGKGLIKQFDDEPVRQIVGIVGDARDQGLNFEPEPRMYVPQAQVPDAANARGASLAWVIRGEVAPLSLSRAIQEQLRQVTGAPASDIQTMDDVVSVSTSRQRFNMLLMTVFACAALAVAAIGIYGLMAFSVEQRRPEIGIRLALGAKQNRIQWMIVLQGMRLAVIGVIIGLSFGLNLTSFIRGFLFRVEPWDPLTFVTISLVVSASALLAVWLPARRANRINPIDALRYE